jgi:hypothetical protein
MADKKSGDDQIVAKFAQQHHHDCSNNNMGCKKENSTKLGTICSIKFAVTL